MLYLIYTFAFSLAAAHYFQAEYLPAAAAAVFFMFFGMLLYEINRIANELQALNAKFIITVKKDDETEPEKKD